jgi:aminocarboxymuconate-semialdehyde decarboxylase
MPWVDPRDIAAVATGRLLAGDWTGRQVQAVHGPADLTWPEAAAALARLVYSGHMERHPRQLVIAHHGGGMVPHFSARLAMGPGYRQIKDTLPRPPLDYFRRFHVDTALFGAPHAVRCVLDFFGPRQVLFGTDMPLGPEGAIAATMADLDAAGLSDEDLAAVYSGNAVRVLGLRAETSPSVGQPGAES